MSPFVNTILGISFLVVGTAATFLMYHLWGYPYDKEKLKSAAPPSLMYLHRLLGYVYLAIYIALMIQMVPRMWTYQIELPARTVMHLTIGFTIGAILICKIAIVRFFRHLEGTLIPILGTVLWILTVLIILLSAPFSLREVYLNRLAVGNTETQGANLERLEILLEEAGLEDETERGKYVTQESLNLGREILYNKCTKCHDLRIVLAKPRTAKNWQVTVRRMAKLSKLIAPINKEQQWQVTSYLIAITPDIQSSAKVKRDQQVNLQKSKEAIAKIKSPKDESAPDTIVGDPVKFSKKAAEFLYQRKCTQCHGLDVVEGYVYDDRPAVSGILERMVGEGLEATERQLEILEHYLSEKFIK